MTNVFTVDAIREEARKKFAPVKIAVSDGSEVELKALLRLGQKDREAVADALKEIREINEDDSEADDELVDEYSELVASLVAKIIKVVANTPRKLLADLDDEDPRIKAALHTRVLELWMEGAQLGEAAPSPNS